ncbi:hypothetical protein CC80DRAFT_554627 [Byssothecium circinans]|uniref:Uncharacterized protein n=1 Tax=Byssothecium circinans TaxID=147558 RepID=A0A6A5TML8_9PLEO|nr:hypothetical protein CC80DRAFT_554627 [Byssothecium circinans]
MDKPTDENLDTSKSHAGGTYTKAQIGGLVAVLGIALSIVLAILIRLGLNLWHNTRRPVGANMWIELTSSSTSTSNVTVTMAPTAMPLALTEGTTHGTGTLETTSSTGVMETSWDNMPLDFTGAMDTTPLTCTHTSPSPSNRTPTTAAPTSTSTPSLTPSHPTLTPLTPMQEENCIANIIMYHHTLRCNLRIHDKSDFNKGTFIAGIAYGGLCGGLASFLSQECPREFHCGVVVSGMDVPDGVDMEFVKCFCLGRIGKLYRCDADMFLDMVEQIPVVKFGGL